MKTAKRILALLLALLLALTLACGLLPAALAAAPAAPAEPDATIVVINPYNFPDENFREYVLYVLDLDHDYTLNDAEIAAAMSIDVSNLDISNLKGIEFFTALQTLDCSLNPIEYWDFSNVQSLQKLNCSLCYGLVYLSVSGNASLKELDVTGNELTSLDVRNNTQLENLDVSGNELASLDVRNNTQLENLDVSGNNIVQIDVSKNLALENLNVLGNKLFSLDVSKNLALKMLNCGGNKLTSLDVSNNTQLEELNCQRNNLTSLDVSNNTQLKKLDCGNNNLTSLNVSKNTNLNNLDCHGNSIATLNIGNCPNLVDAYKNGIRYTVSGGSGEYWWSYKLESSGYRLAVDKTTEISTVHTALDLGNYTFDFRSGPVEHPGFDIALELVVMANQGDIGISSGGGYVSLLDLDLDGHSDVRVYSKDGKSYFYVDSHTNLRGTYTLTVSEAVKNAFVSSDLDYYSSFTFQYPSPWNPFTDVKEGKDYYDAILWAYYHDPQVTAGVTATTFGVGKAVKRGDAMFYLWVAAGKPEPTLTKSPFTDVTDPKAYYYKAILWAYENGITSGVSATEFGRKKTVSRRDMLVFLYKQQGSPVPTLTQSPYSDVTDPKAYYYKAVLWAYEKGIEKGAGGKFNGKTNCLRETVVLWMYRVLAD